MKSKIINTVLLILVFGLAGTVSAQQAGRGVKIETRTVKSVSGEVSGISKDFIAILYHRDEKTGTEEELLLPIPKDIKIEHRKSLDQIGVGDIVDIEFEEITEEGAEGTKTKREAKVISFVRAAKKQPQAPALTSGSE